MYLRVAITLANISNYKLLVIPKWGWISKSVLNWAMVLFIAHQFNSSFVRGRLWYFFQKFLSRTLKGSQARKVGNHFARSNEVSLQDTAAATIKPSAFSCVHTGRRWTAEEEWSFQHSSVFPGLSVCESWYFGSQHGSTRGVRLTTVIVPCWSRLPQPWDWTMKYSKMPGLRGGGLWQCNVKCETTEHL